MQRHLGDRKSAQALCSGKPDEPRVCTILMAERVSYKYDRVSNTHKVSGQFLKNTYITGQFLRNIQVSGQFLKNAHVSGQFLKLFFSVFFLTFFL